MACAHCGRPYIVTDDRTHYSVARGCYCAWLTSRALAPRVIQSPSTTPSQAEIDAYVDGVYGTAFN